MGQLLPLQTDPAPSHVPPAVPQPEEVSARQLPLEKQQAPLGRGHEPHTEP